MSRSNHFTHCNPDAVVKDTPSQSLYEAAKWDELWSPDDKLSILHYPETAARAEGALILFSELRRSVAQLPESLQWYITKLGSLTRRVEQMLEGFDSEASRRGWKTDATPIQILTTDIENSQDSSVAEMTILAEGLDPTHLIPLKAAKGSFEPIATSPGTARLRDTLVEARTSHPDLFGHFMRNVIRLSACTEKIDLLEQLVQNRNALGTLKQASGILSTLKGPLTDKYKYNREARSFVYTGFHNAPVEIQQAMNQGQVRSAVISLCSQAETERLGEALLEDAWSLYQQELESTGPKPSKVIDALHSFYVDAQKENVLDPTAYILTRLCQMSEEDFASLSTLDGFDGSEKQSDHEPSLDTNRASRVQLLSLEGPSGQGM